MATIRTLLSTGKSSSRPRAALAALVAALLATFLWLSVAGADGDLSASFVISVREADDGRSELAVQQVGQDSSLGPILLPRGRFLPARVGDGRWLYTTPISVPQERSASSTSHLSLRIDGDQLQLVAGDAVYTTTCGSIGLRRHETRIAAIFDYPPACDEPGPPVTVLWLGTSELELSTDDPQQHAAYAWEREVGDTYLPQILRDPISLARAQTISNAVFADHFNARMRAPRVHVVSPEDIEEGFAAQYRHDCRCIEVILSSLNAMTVLHELGHALVAAEHRWNVGHGPEFIAQRLALWERYIPNFDDASSRSLADQYGLEIAERVPASATGVRWNVQQVQAALGVPTHWDSPPFGTSPLYERSDRRDEHEAGTIWLRIAARRLANGVVETALQTRGSDGSWGELEQPYRNHRNQLPTIDGWQSTSTIGVTAPSWVMSGTVEDDQIAWESDIGRVADQCGRLMLYKLKASVVTSHLVSPDCREWTDWSPMLLIPQTGSTAEAQESRFRDWWNLQRWNQDPLTEAMDTELQLHEARHLVRLILEDYGFSEADVETRLSSTGANTEIVHTMNYGNGGRYFWTSTSYERLPDIGTILRSLARVIVRESVGANAAWSLDAYDERFVAQLVDMLDRYVHSFDDQRSHWDAHLLQLDIADEAPMNGRIGDHVRQVRQYHP